MTHQVLTKIGDWDPVTHYQDVAVAEGYDRARFHGLLGRTFNALERRAIRCAFSDLPKSALIADIPCGTGRLSEALLEDGFRVAGLDVSPAMLHVAQRRLTRFGERFSPQVADLRDLSQIPPGTYDAVLCARVLLHFPMDDQIEMLRNVAMISRGPVVFTHDLNSSYYRVARNIKHKFRKARTTTHIVTETELAALLAAAGLKETRRFRPMSKIKASAIIVAAKR